MSDDYEVGYGKPPRQHRFKPGNQAAAKRKRKRRSGRGGGEMMSIAQVLERALTTKRRLKRGDDYVTLYAGEVLVERLVGFIINGSARDLMQVVAMIERYLPQALPGEPERLEVIYRRAEGSSVALPSADLWEDDPSCA